MGLVELLGFSDHGWGPALLRAAGMTLLLTAVALMIGALVGALVAMAKLSSLRALRWLGELYSLLLRGIPELLVIYLFYFGGASMVSAVAHWFGAGEGYIDVPPFAIGALAVGLISGSYQAEVYRGAYLAVPKGELEAAAAIGMSPALRLRRVLIPQVLRIALPGLGNVWQMSLKDSALISVIGLVELMRASQVAAGSTRQYFTFYIVGGIGYLVLTWMSGRLFGVAEARVRRTRRTNPMHS
ncbi:ABC transporter permease subunit [Pseudomonas sp. RIT-PI-S]|uniref:ABC transporter permease n=1 Tax=Pseudomonas sp. RIT-PI-S TaxID=3035295 RepID=UPI0021DA56DE|nr:ABC transporter permease subunit [Pseudomonas sp. RIT-PI-S]